MILTEVHAFGGVVLAIDLGEEAIEGQELWHLAPIRLPIRYPQHVQGVQGTVKGGRRPRFVPGHGCPSSSTFQVNPRELTPPIPLPSISRGFTDRVIPRCETIFRSSVSPNSPPPRTSSVPTSNNSSPRTSDSLSPTVSSSPGVPSSPTDRRLSTKQFVRFEMWRGVGLEVVRMSFGGVGAG
jgi:hypothetical protein